MRKLFSFLLLLAAMQAHAEQKPLPPDEAFQFKAEVTSPTTIKTTWEIAAGHYLSREQFKFETENADLKLSPPSFPAGESKEDEATKTKHEIYRDKLEIDIPVERGQTLAQAVEMTLKVKYQGCSDTGLCYPPQRKTVVLQLAAAPDAVVAVTDAAKPTDAAPVSTTTPEATSGSKLPDIFKNAGIKPTDKTLTVDEAFAFSLEAVNKGYIKARWAIQPEHHLYRPKITFSVKEPQNATLGKPEFPKGIMVDDEFYGKIEVFDSDIEVLIPVEPTTGLEKLVVTTQYQGCADKTGVCYPPVKKTHELKLAGLAEATTIPKAAEKLETTTKINEQDALAQKLGDSSFLQIMLITFGLGLLLAFTPCIFPMIPILSGIIAGYGNTSSRKAFFLSLTYVVSGAVAYAIIGFVFGLFGQNLQTALQNPIALGLMSALFVALALSMFGFYDLQLPSSLQSRLSEISNKQESGSFVGAAVMGFLSTLIVGPCAGPAVAGVLTFITQSQNALLGAVALFSLGMGIGVPLLLIGTSAGHLLPRAGAWMDTVKVIFGIIMLGMAIYMLRSIVSIEVIMALTGILLVSSGVYMGALEKANEEAGGWGRFWKSIGMIQLFYGGLMLLGLAAGSQNLLQPLKGVFSVSGESAVTVAKQGIKFQKIKGLDGLKAAIETAKAQNRPVMLDFTADFCRSCAKMEETTFKSEKVVTALGNTLALKADVSEQDAADIALQKQFDVPGPPALVFFNSKGEELRPFRLIGEISAEKLEAHANEFMAQAANR